MKYPNLTSYLFICTLTFFLSSCGGGGGNDTSEPLETNACGTLGLQTRSINSRIINGTSCETTNSPVVRVFIRSLLFGTSSCSGTFISSKEVLTAGHCFLNDFSEVSVQLDNSEVAVSEIVIHPEFFVDNQNGRVVNDAAILRIQEPLSTVSILPIITSQKAESGDILSIFGFGLDENQNLGTLRSGEMRINEVNTISIRALFTGEGSNTCVGDSGGPAVLTLSNGTSGIVGLVSSGTITDCTVGDTSIFANVQEESILNFISTQVEGLTQQ